MKLPMLALLAGLSFSAVSIPYAAAQTPKKEVSKADKTKAKKAVTAAEKSVKKGDFEKALAAYQEAYGLDPTPDTQASIGDCYTSLTRYKEAITAYNQYLTEAGFAHPRRAEIEKKIPEVKLSIANAAKTKGDVAFTSEKDYNKALSLYKEAQEMSQDPIYFYKMGQAHAKLNNYKDGIDAFTSFLQKAPATDTNRADAEQQTAMLQQGAADAAFAAGQYDEAIAYYRMLYAKDAQPKRLAELGRCYQKMGKTEDANKNFRTFLEKSDPNDPLRPEIEAQLPKKAAANTAKNDKGNKNKNNKSDKTEDPTTEKSAAPKVFLGMAFTTGALAAAAGVGAFLSTQRLNELTAPASAADLDTDQIALHQARRTLLAPAADIFLGVAVVTGVVGVIARSKNKPEKAAQLQIGPTNVAVVVKF